MFGSQRMTFHGAELLLYFMAAWLPPFCLKCYCQGWPPRWRSIVWLAVVLVLTSSAWTWELYDSWLSMTGGKYRQSFPSWETVFYDYGSHFRAAAMIFVLSSALTVIYCIIRRPDLAKTGPADRVGP